MRMRLGSALADSGPVTILAAIAAAGSFTHIKDTARQHGQHGWMSWAIAVCIDLTCVMAARERQRDKRTGRRTGPVSWPTIVLTAGIIASLAANLAQAQQTTWGWLTAATPAVAFLLAISMLERRAAATRTPPPPAPGQAQPPPSFPAHPQPSAFSSDPRPTVPDGPRPEITTPDGPHPALEATGHTRREIPGPHPDGQTASTPAPAAPLIEFARRVATEHETAHGRPITRDALRARLGVSNQLASDLLRHIRTAPETGD